MLSWSDDNERKSSGKGGKGWELLRNSLGSKTAAAGAVKPTAPPSSGLKTAASGRLSYDSPLVFRASMDHEEHQSTAHWDLWRHADAGAMNDPADAATTVDIHAHLVKGNSTSGMQVKPAANEAPLDPPMAPPSVSQTTPFMKVFKRQDTPAPNPPSPSPSPFSTPSTVSCTVSGSFQTPSTMFATPSDTFITPPSTISTPFTTVSTFTAEAKSPGFTGGAVSSTPPSAEAKHSGFGNPALQSMPLDMPLKGKSQEADDEQLLLAQLGIQLDPLPPALSRTLKSSSSMGSSFSGSPGSDSYFAGKHEVWWSHLPTAPLNDIPEDKEPAPAHSLGPAPSIPQGAMTRHSLDKSHSLDRNHSLDKGDGPMVTRPRASGNLSSPFDMADSLDTICDGLSKTMTECRTVPKDLSGPATPAPVRPAIPGPIDEDSIATPTTPPATAEKSPNQGFTQVLAVLDEMEDWDPFDALVMERHASTQLPASWAPCADPVPEPLNKFMPHLPTTSRPPQGTSTAVQPATATPGSSAVLQAGTPTSRSTTTTPPDRAVASSSMFSDVGIVHAANFQGSPPAVVPPPAAGTKVLFLGRSRSMKI